METKSLFARIITESNSEELCEAQRMITKALDERRKKAREDAWNKVVNAIKEYAITFGNIEIETDDYSFYLTTYDCYSQNGRIVIECEED